jgi:hypothetical protein
MVNYVGQIEYESFFFKLSPENNSLCLRQGAGVKVASAQEKAVCFIRFV